MRLAMLIIEGDESVAGLFAEIFSQEGWEVNTLLGGANVTGALLESKHYDLITVSYRFAVTNGVDMIRLIREIKHRKETPVLMVTGSPNVTQEALAAGANEVLIKPIEPSSLVAAVKRHTESTVAQENDEARLRGMRGYWKRGKSLSIATCNLTGKPH